MNEYKAAEGYAIGMAAQLILGAKPVFEDDTIFGDPDTTHRPSSLAEFDE
jgi:hypothetical protein